jgi:hypothetical protein
MLERYALRIRAETLLEARPTAVTKNDQLRAQRRVRSLPCERESSQQ